MWQNDKGKGKSGGSGGGNKRYPDIRDLGHCFKVLCPEELVSCLMGHGGKTKDQIQDETGARLVVSQRNEYFPNTRFRVLAVHHEVAEGIVSAVGRILEKIVDCGEKEQSVVSRTGMRTDLEFLGREPGEYIFRAALSPRMSGNIIGPKGVKVQQIRERSRARISIDKDVVCNHQILTVVANFDGLRNALGLVNEYVQEEAGSDWFKAWAADMTFQTVQVGGNQGRRDRERSPRRVEQSRATAWDPNWRGELDARSTFPTNNDFHSQQKGEVDYGMLQVLESALYELPPGALDEEISIRCTFPKNKVSALEGKNGSFIQEASLSTGTMIKFETEEDTDGDAPMQQTLLLHGPLMNVYRAHAVMMNRYHETERMPENPKDNEMIDLKTQLDALHKQLAEVKKAKASGKGKMKG